jgi:hypothetical protein
MNKTENLYNCLRGIEKNMQRLRTEERVLDYRIQEIFADWMNAEQYGRRINQDRQHLQCKFIESCNNRIAEIERRLKFQGSLHARLMDIYDERLRADFAKFLN